MYNDALKLFHIEIKTVQKGHLIFVTDGNGNPVRHPIKMSDFEERPRYFLSEHLILGQHSVKCADYELTMERCGVLKSLVLKGLIRQLHTQKEGEDQRRNKQKLRLQKKKGKWNKL